MSFRGSWVSEFIYCPKCCEAFHAFLKETGAERLSVGKYWSGDQIAEGVFAGRIGDLGGREVWVWGEQLQPELERLICHPMRVAVVGETDAKVLDVVPDNAAADVGR